MRAMVVVKQNIVIRNSHGNNRELIKRVHCWLRYNVLSHKQHFKDDVWNLNETLIKTHLQIIVYFFYS